MNTAASVRKSGELVTTREDSAAAERAAKVEPVQAAGEMLAVSTERDTARGRDSQKFFYRWGRLLSSTLIKLRSRFDGDFDQYLIYMVFVLSDLSRKAQYSTNPQSESQQNHRDVGLNTLSIADITEIPRETARRKLRLLVEARYLRRGANQLYYLGERYDTDEFVDDLIPLFSDYAAP